MTSKITLVSLLALAIGCAAPDGEQILAHSDLGLVTMAELESYRAENRAFLPSPGPDTDQDAWRRHLVERLLIERALAASSPGLDELTESERHAMEQERDLILIDEYRRAVILPRAAVRDDEVREYFENHPNEFGRPQQIRVRHIFKRVSRTASAGERQAVRSAMERLLEEIESGSRFEDLARQESDSETAPMGGLIGRLARGDLDPSIEQVVWNLKEGELSGVVPTPVGFHIFRVDDRSDVRNPSFEEVRATLGNRLSAERHEEVESRLFEQLLAESGAVFRPELASAPECAAESLLFAIGDRRITRATTDSYSGSLSFRDLRELPPEAWLAEAAREALFAWKAEQLGLANHLEVAERIESAQQSRMNRLAYEKVLVQHLDTLEHDGTLEAFFNENRRRFQTPRLHHLRLIAVGFEDFDPPYRGYEYLDEVREEILSDRRDFATAARELSTDPSAPRGGDAGWVRLDGFAAWAGPVAHQEVASLEPGAISNPLLVAPYNEKAFRHDRQGFALVRVEGVREPTTPSFEEAIDRVRSRYLETHRAEIDEAVRQMILGSIHADIS